jgi:ribose transport system substrate-binding protein
MGKNKVIAIVALVALSVVLMILFVVLHGSIDETAKNGGGRMLHMLPGILKPDTRDEVQPVSGRGPKGESPSSISDVLALLTEKDIQKVRGGGFRSVICMQDINNDWSRLQVKGLRMVLERFGVDITAVTDGEFDLDKQLADYKNAISLKPDIMITIPLHTDKCAMALRRAVQAGIKLVFMDTVPAGFVHPRDYASVVIADSYANGRVSAEIIAERLGGKGKVAMLHWQNKMFTCDERTRAARETFADFPDIDVVSEAYFEGVYDVPKLTEEILDQHPDLNGLWVVWDTPAMEAVHIIKQMKKDVIVATVDLGYAVAKAIAAGDVVVGTGAQHPYDQGVAEALIAVVALAGKTAPAYVVVPGEKVTRRTLARAWHRVYQSALPRDVKALVKDMN